jgi:hypothetical protein
MFCGIRNSMNGIALNMAAAPARAISAAASFAAGLPAAM